MIHTYRSIIDPSQVWEGDFQKLKVARLAEKAVVTVLKEFHLSPAAALNLEAAAGTRCTAIRQRIQEELKKAGIA